MTSTSTTLIGTNQLANGRDNTDGGNDDNNNNEDNNHNRNCNHNHNRYKRPWFAEGRPKVPLEALAPRNRYKRPLRAVQDNGHPRLLRTLSQMVFPSKHNAPTTREKRRK